MGSSGSGGETNPTPSRRSPLQVGLHKVGSRWHELPHHCQRDGVSEEGRAVLIGSGQVVPRS